jgi:hypothetical protein
MFGAQYPSVNFSSSTTAGADLLMDWASTRHSEQDTAEGM